MSTIFNSSVDVSERLQVVRRLTRDECETALANPANERLQATVIKALQARVRKLSKAVTTTNRKITPVVLPLPVNMRKLQRDHANYRAGQPQSDPRCSSCAHESASWAARNAKQHGTGCSFFKLPCQKHGVCDAHEQSSRKAKP